MNALAILFLRIETAYHFADAYLAAHRGDMKFAADAESRAHECERKIITIELNRRMA